MILNIIIVLLIAAIIVPVAMFYTGERNTERMGNLLKINRTAFYCLLVLANIVIFSSPVFAEEAATAVASSGITDEGLRYIAAALSTGFATIGAGIAVSSAATAALGALSEDGTIMGKALIFVGLAEGIAIYGLIISILILNA